MSLTMWLSLLGACTVISLTPGAGAVNTMSTSLLYGWRTSLSTILGQQGALIAQILIVAAGLGVIVANSPIIFDAIRYGGAAYLVYLGARMIFARTPPAETATAAQPRLDTGTGTTCPQPAMTSSVTPGVSPWALIRRGFWVYMSNPKAIVFILAFAPQFLNPAQPMIPQYALLMATMVGVDIIVMWCGFAIVARTLTTFSRSAHGQKILNTIFGILFIFVAGILVFVGH